jgi:glycosyltransferase involved in cell wall biosynthesis
MLLDFVPDQRRAMESFLLCLTHQLRTEGWRTIFVFAGEPSHAFAARLKDEESDYRVVEFPLNRQSFEALVASLNGVSPVLLTNTYVSCFNPYVLQLKKRLGIRYWLVHDVSSGVASPKSGLKRLLARLRGWYYGRHIDRVLAVSEFIARRNVEQVFLPRAKVKVLPNCVDLSRFHPGSEPVTDRSGEPRAVFVGQLIPEKGVRTLLQSWLLLQQRHEPLAATLELAGEGVLENELRTYVAEHALTRVNFLGQIADVAALYRAATVVVVPSEWAEAAAFVIVEAMACGACVLVSDAGGNPDLIGRDEEGGRLFRAGNSAELAEKLYALLSDPAARQLYQKQARARAERLFGLDNMVHGFIREVQDICISCPR